MSNPEPSSSQGQSKWSRWGRKAFDKSIVVSDWAAGYANAGSAKIGGERFFPKTDDFPEEVAKCERILRAFTVEGVAAEEKETDVSDGKGSFIKKKVKVLRKIPPQLVKRAKGILIYTGMRSGIAPLGGAGGVGLMLAHLPDGSWSAPSSITPNNIAVGLLLGFDIFDAVLLVNTTEAMEAFKKHKVTMGAETAVAAGPFGAGISGEMGVDRMPVYSYVRSRGLYAGVEAMAQAFLHRFDENERVYYWPGITAADIFEGKVRIPPVVASLHRALRDAETGIAQGGSLDRVVYENVKAPPNPAVRALQGHDSSDMLEDGERLKLPPTPEELDALEGAGIPDEYDLEMDRKGLQKKLEFEKKEREEIFALPPPPRHPKVSTYWKHRTAGVDGGRRMPPALPGRNGAVVRSPLGSEMDEAPVTATLQEVSLDDGADNSNRYSVEGADLPAYQETEAQEVVRDEKQADGDSAKQESGADTDFEDATSASQSSTYPDKAALPAIVEPAQRAISPRPESVKSTSSTNTLEAAKRPSRPPRTRRPIIATTAQTKMVVLLDWDETISASDTLGLIAPPAGEQEHGPDFGHYGEAYMADMKAHEDEFGERDSLDRQLAYLESMDAVELASQSRVEEDLLFRDVKLSDILQRAEGVPLRDGWKETDAWLVSNKASVETNIISVGWSAAFIQRALETSRGAALDGIPRTINANEIEMIDGVGTGRITKSTDSSALQEDAARGGIRTGIHKRAEMQRLLARFDDKPRTVYVGDSNTDLPCLLEADYGVLMGGNESLRATVERVGLKGQLVEAQDWLKTSKKANKDKTLIAASSWHDGLLVLQRILEES